MYTDTPAAGCRRCSCRSAERLLRRSFHFSLIRSYITVKFIVLRISSMYRAQYRPTIPDVAHCACASSVCVFVNTKWSQCWLGHRSRNIVFSVHESKSIQRAGQQEKKIEIYKIIQVHLQAFSFAFLSIFSSRCACVPPFFFAEWNKNKKKQEQKKTFLVVVFRSIS